jgi:hypothetical protein
MGILYLIGDNLSDEVCRHYHSCPEFSINSMNCKMEDNRKCDVTACTKQTTDACKVDDCVTTAVVFLGVSTVFNLLLIFLEHPSLLKPALPAIGIAHKRWGAGFNLY